MRWIWMTLCLAMAGPAFADESERALDAIARSEWEISGVPGLAYAVFEDGRIQSGAQGVVRAGQDTGVTADTPFALGSISKSFTALAILQLEEAGQVELDGAVSAYLPAFEAAPGRSITLRQLLSHTSGYSTSQGNVNPDGAAILQDRVAQIATWQTSHAPGEHWEYSNANYVVLGAVIETVSGRDYADYIEAEILTPLGMQHSRVADGRADPAMATPHVPWFGSRRALPGQLPDPASAPAGGVIASAQDVALYLGMMMNGQDDLITAEHKALMMRPASDAAPFYGLGWYVDTRNGSVSHTGTTPGGETLALMRPDEGRAVVVLVNASSGLGFGETGRLRYAVALAAFGETLAPDGGVWGRKLLTLMFWILPPLFLAGIAIAWLKRAGLRAKTGVSGMFSLWFPLPVSLALAWVSLFLIPALFGISLSTLALYQPDWVIALWATAVTGLAWALFRLGVYFAPGRH
ncbi:serine hydrolase domain-containing protein [Maricaulis parjimensis]|uniref:serine hydrolase domain-containing protein n=1 Tax=Maricaulis parjimensis TaxID=144023 RepID=UPI00193AD3FD|nr:serine hydrolase domain-containing protein [Maricaulis parjimensis]